jgi:predicted dinucleotide-binding enzyme
MNFGVIGPGNIGEVIVRTLRDAGYPVKMANARGPESLRDLAAKTGATPVALEQVVQDVDMLFIVVPQKAIPGLPEGLLMGIIAARVFGRKPTATAPAEGKPS